MTKEPGGLMEVKVPAIQNELRLAAGTRITQSLQLPVFATLSCQQTGTFDLHSTRSDASDPTIPRLDANGDFRIGDVLDSVPSDCASPLLVIRAAANGTGSPSASRSASSEPSRSSVPEISEPDLEIGLASSPHGRC